MTSIEQLIIKFNVDPEINRIKSYYNSDNFWKVLGIERKEQKHSAFLKWLLDLERGGSPQPRNQFLNLLLDKCPDDAMQQKEMVDFKNAILLNDYRITSWTSELEKPIRQLCKIRYDDKIDIYINCKVEIGKKTYNLEVVIENKVRSGEGKCKKKTL